MMTNLLNIIDRFENSRLLVVGDIMADEFVWGRVNRISPEAPVPVVEVVDETILPGGAANVANNIISLEGKAELVGVIGQDKIGEDLTADLKQRKIGTEGILAVQERPTIQKTRIIAHSQQVVRVDRENRKEIDPALTETILDYCGGLISDIDAVIISDYGKGVIIPPLIEKLVALSREFDRPVVVDPKIGHLKSYKRISVLTPNHHEAGLLSGKPITDEESLIEVGWFLLNLLECEAVLITRGEKGMSLFPRQGEVTHIPTVAREVYDVTGAGDTVVAVFTLALASGAGLLEAATLANYAAGIVVGKVGTATVTRGELKKELSLKS
ncbi:MAG: D-glycero-beta-D-manno-heptose-7-phosphate kinase [bacterium]